MSSVLCSAVADEAATLISDPDYRRVTRPDWLIFLNATARTMARRMNIIEVEAFFDITSESDLYALPDDCKQMREIQVTQSPSDGATYYSLDEKFDDEFRARRQRSRQVGDPKIYLMRQGFFQLDPFPSADYTNGGKITYWAMPDDITDMTIQYVPFANVLRDTLREGMIVHALKKLEKFDAAAAREKEWDASLVLDRNTVEDRSADRRSKIRPLSSRSMYGGQV
jgi:hypothetical protein